MDFLDLKDKIAIVTGGATGIGQGAAREFAEFGAQVIILDLNEKEAEKTVRSIEEAGGKALFIRCNMAKDEDVKAAVDEVIRRFGTVHILFNNAGVAAEVASVEDLKEEYWDRQFQINLFGDIRASRAVLPYMKAQKWGRIINNSSGSGVIGVEMLAHYGAAKAGKIGFTMSLAREVASMGITVNAIATPTTVTPQFVEADYAELPQIPAGRFAYPKDIADLVLFLASDRASYITGQVIAPNGGRHMPI